MKRSSLKRLKQKLTLGTVVPRCLLVVGIRSLALIRELCLHIEKTLAVAAPVRLASRFTISYLNTLP